MGARAPKNGHPRVVLITCEAVAEWLSIKVGHVQVLARRGELKGRKVGGLWRFQESEVQAFIDGQAKGESDTETPVAASLQAGS